MTSYSLGFKSRMVKRMAGSEGISANALSMEVGVAQATLSRWLRDGRMLGGMSKKKQDSSKKSRRRNPNMPPTTFEGKVSSVEL